MLGRECWGVSDVAAPFHDRVLQLTRENTFGQISHPLLEHIPAELRVPGIW